MVSAVFIFEIRLRKLNKLHSLRKYNLLRNLCKLRNYCGAISVLLKQHPGVLRELIAGADVKRLSILLND